ncbi:MAG: hypothetical protein J0L77_03685 [Alphaproteobacteria bacterium]|nr:hypothetical protein [Alphaproteobacteria bacterium]
MSGGILSWIFGVSTGSALDRVANMANHNLAFNAMVPYAPSLKAFANNDEFKRDLHAALKKPEFRNFVQTTLDQGGAGKLGAMFNDPQAQRFAPALVKLAAHDPTFDTKKLTKLTNDLAAHADLAKIEKEKGVLTPEQIQQRQVLRKSMANGLTEMGVNVGLGANAMDPKILLNFIKDVFEKGPAQAVQGLMSSLKEGGASPQALAGVEKFGTFFGNTLQTFGQPYADFFGHYGPRISANISNLTKDASAMAGGGLTDQALARIGSSANPAGDRGQTSQSFNPNATGARTDGYRPEIPAVTGPLPAMPQGQGPSMFIGAP